MSNDTDPEALAPSVALSTTGRPGPRLRPMSARDLAAIAFYHRRIVLACVVIGVIIGGLAALATRTQFTASALLIVLIGSDSASPQDVSGVGPGSVNIDGLKVLQSEISIIESVDVIEQALTKMGPATVFPEVAQRRLFGLLPPPPADQQLARAAELLRRDLFAADSQNSGNNSLFNGSNIMRVSLTLPDRTLALHTLDAVVQAYLDHRRTLYGAQGSRFLLAELDRNRADLTTLEAEIAKVRAQYHVLDITQDIASAGARLDSAVARENAARERLQAVRAELAAATGTLRRVPERVFDSRERTNHPNNDDTRNTLLRLQLERAHIASQYASGYPALAELDRKIADVTAVLQAEARRPENFTERDVRNPSSDLLNGRIVTLQGEAQGLASEIEELGRQFDDAQARAAELRAADLQLHDLQRRRDVLENVQRQIALREASVRVQDTVTAARNANVTVVQQADAPYTGRYMGFSYLAGASFAGLMAGLAALLVAARLRRVYVVAREAERDLGLPALAECAGPAPQFTNAGARRELANLASLLVDEAQSAGRFADRGLVVIEVTALEAAPCLGLATALAAEFAQTQGLRTLLIDIDADHPATGASAAPAGTADWPVTPEGKRVAAMPGAVPGLWLAAHVTPALLAGRFRDFDPGLRQRCDAIVVSAAGGPRHHAVRRMAALADATVMLVVAERTHATPAAELRDAVISAGGSLAGIVVGGLRSTLPPFVERWI